MRPGTALVIIIVVFMAVLMHHAWLIDKNQNRLDDLEQRVTTFETVRIEMVAEPKGGER